MVWRSPIWRNSHLGNNLKNSTLFLELNTWTWKPATCLVSIGSSVTFTIWHAIGTSVFLSTKCNSRVKKPLNHVSAKIGGPYSFMGTGWYWKLTTWKLVGGAITILEILVREGWSHILWKIKNGWNHQPENNGDSIQIPKKIQHGKFMTVLDGTGLKWNTKTKHINKMALAGLRMRHFTYR